MTELDLKDPFESIVQNTRLNPEQKRQQLILRYLKEKQEALKLYGTYSIAKINWLQRKLWDAKRDIMSADQLTDEHKPNTGFVPNRYDKPQIKSFNEGKLLFDTTSSLNDLLPD